VSVQELAAVFFDNNLNMYLVREGDETGSVVFYVASGQIKFMRCACVRVCVCARARMYVHVRFAPHSLTLQLIQAALASLTPPQQIQPSLLIMVRQALHRHPQLNGLRQPALGRLLR